MGILAPLTFKFFLCSKPCPTRVRFGGSFVLILTEFLLVLFSVDVVVFKLKDLF